jgi:N utilization substance protein A
MAINQICSERGLPEEVIFEAIESALVSAYRKNFGGGQNIRAAIDRKTGEPQVFLECVVVDEVQDDRFQLSLAQARKMDPRVQVGEVIEKDVTPRSFGRIAAQTAKQVILQRIREAERDALFSSYADREGELINGMVANVTSHAITLNLGRTEATMPRAQQVPGERYRIGQRVRAYVMEVRRASRGPQIIVSRTHRHMLRRLLELEVPEIYNGTVEIKAIAREAGSRSKVAVAALQDGVDPVGSCVGIRGMRIQSIVNELGGEKIDVVEWDADTSTFIANALSPAKVNYAVLGDATSNGKTATVVVPDDQLSLAIGKEGQNARLAAKLTGWRIDIKSMTEAKGEAIQPDALTVATTKERDILAMAEAILLGKAAPQDEAEPEAQEAVAEADAEPAPAAEAAEAAEATESAQEAEVQETEAAEPQPATSLLEQAQELLRSREVEAEQAVQEPEPERVPVAEAAPEPVAQVEPEPEAEPEPEPEAALPVAQEAAEEEKEAVAQVEPVEEPEPEVEPEPEKIILRRSTDSSEDKGRSSRLGMPRFQYVRDERLEPIEEPEKDKKSRKRRRRLVVDEETGKLVPRPVHKHKDDQEWGGSD